MTVVRTRKSICKLTDAELDKLIHAFHEIQKNKPGEPGHPNLKSFQVIAGLHGQPFRGAGYGNSAWWGGYCHHGNVLFPTWHRAYLLHLERALQSVSGCEDVALPYWDEMEGDNSTQRIPPIFLQQKYTFHNTLENCGTTTIDNPLYSYTLQQGFFDKLARYIEAPKKEKKGDQSDQSKQGKLQDYGKYAGYKTVRCPYSGLVGKDDLKDTIEHNWLIDSMGMGYADKILNRNITRWQDAAVRSDSYGKHHVEGARQEYLRCLEAPNYTVFSNTTSAGKWNDDKISQVGRPDYDKHHVTGEYVVSLERPHNSMHLAVGGYDFPNLREPCPEFQGANGDMGENDSAAFDPIFFFHHCFVDLVFWSWQEQHGRQIKVIQDYPGTSSVDDQGPTPKMAADSALDENTPLYPFRENPIEENGRFLTSVVSDSNSVHLASAESVIALGVSR
ncbi:tyrosinase [Aspergillus udagawae]|uniref:tyrosinase n=1 Tax=Aspergillus udagawae TaxID=91492 RepID=A0A8E0R4H9_9EURO|nr:uncharacterized protein Aud_002055 [Aspergillus udagawae]GIC94726.1 hypothetical protein Aud_002055 [Aspergillus udagawae]